MSCRSLSIRWENVASTMSSLHSVVPHFRLQYATFVRNVVVYVKVNVSSHNQPRQLYSRFPMSTHPIPPISSSCHVYRFNFQYWYTVPAATDNDVPCLTTSHFIFKIQCDNCTWRIVHRILLICLFLVNDHDFYVDELSFRLMIFYHKFQSFHHTLRCPMLIIPNTNYSLCDLTSLCSHWEASRYALGTQGAVMGACPRWNTSWRIAMSVIFNHSNSFSSSSVLLCQVWEHLTL